MTGRMPNRIGINAAGDAADPSMGLKRTLMMGICTAPFYAEVVWRGRAGAELSGLVFQSFMSVGAGGNRLVGLQSWRRSGMVSEQRRGCRVGGAIVGPVHARAERGLHRAPHQRKRHAGGLLRAPHQRTDPGRSSRSGRRLRRQGGERECEGHAVALLHLSSENKAPSGDRMPYKCARILSPRGWQRRTIVGTRPSVDRRRQHRYPL